MCMSKLSQMLCFCHYGLGQQKEHFELISALKRKYSSGKMPPPPPQRKSTTTMNTQKILDLDI